MATDKDQVAIYKVNLHCHQCACEIKKPLLRTQGVKSVDVGEEKGEIKVKGEIDVIKIHKLLTKWSKKKVELISPLPQVKIVEAEKKVVTEIKQQISFTTVLKVHLHCDKCGDDLQRKLMKNKGVYFVKTDVKAQTLTIQGSIQSDKLLSYVKEKVHKHAEVISSKSDQEEVKKVEAKSEEIKIVKKVETKSEETKIEKTVETKSEETKIEKKVEAKSEEIKASLPYFIHYVYAPQLFSDENPNACSIM